MGRAGWGAIFAILIVATASCSTTTSPKPSAKDIADARPIAREISSILLNFSAYNYAVIGGINGDRIRTVTTERYAAVARAQASLIAENSTRIIAVAVDSSGPIRDRLVTLADALGEAITLAADPATPARCAAHARRWGWVETVGPMHEAVYRDVTR